MDQDSIFIIKSQNLMSYILNVSHTSASRGNLESTLQATTDHTGQNLSAERKMKTKNKKESNKSYQKKKAIKSSVE